MSYQPGVPSGNIPLNQDYLNIQENFTQINTQYNVDHVPLTSTSGNPPNGYHTVVHQVPFSTTTSNPPNNYPPVLPSGIGFIGQIVTVQANDGIAPGEILYYISGGTANIQMTRNFAPNTTSGITTTMLPGGLILQTGRVIFSGSITTGTVTLSGTNGVNTQNIYSVQATLIGNGTTDNSVTIISTTAGSPGSFNWKRLSNSSSFTGFYWTVICN